MILYFVENLTALGRDKLGEVGLAHAWDEGDELGVRQVNAGPCGTNGVVLSRQAERCAYLPDDQDWAEISPAFGRRRWVGWWKSERPTAESLARSTQCPGKELRLADGSTWIVPQALQVLDGVPTRTVPAKLRRLPDGRWVLGDPLDRYRRLWQIACSIVERSNPHAERPSISVQYDELCEVLGTNYRLGPDEVGALQILDSDPATFAAIVAIVIDQDGFEELKKKEPTA